MLALVGETTSWIGSGGTGSNSNGNPYTTGTAGYRNGGAGGGTNATNSGKPAGNAVAYTGSGGGGSMIYSALAGNGSAGFVVVWWSTDYGAAASTVGNPTYVNSGGFHYYKFRSAGSFTFGAN
jgi:hypothetical protein